jgi:A/G-specific adenine glycosylase
MELLKIWEGLGYYSRSRNLRFAANQIMHDFGGVFPKTPKEIASLKGIGPYTAGAILSIAFHQPEPAIDGNIQRVTSRLFELSDDISKPQSRKTFDAVMRKIISHDFPGEFNQAMMDLGSGICKPKNPNCDICPIQAFCQSREHSTQLNFPVKSKKLKQKLIYYFAYAIQNEEGEYIIIQRPEEGLLSNMWTFPMELVTKDTYMSAQVQASTFTGSEQYPDYSITTKPVGEVTHIFSHLKWHILVFEGRQKNNFVLHDQANVWALPKDSKRSYPKPQQKIFELLKKRND